jgi:hypothetical protein
LKSWRLEVWSPFASTWPSSAHHPYRAQGQRCQRLRHSGGHIAGPQGRLLKRVFDIDMRRCPTCAGGELKIVAAILERAAIGKILTHLGLDPRPLPRGTGERGGPRGPRIRRRLRSARHPGRAAMGWRASAAAGVALRAVSGIRPEPGIEARTATRSRSQPTRVHTRVCVRKRAYASCSPPPMALAAHPGPREGVEIPIR